MLNFYYNGAFCSTSASMHEVFYLTSVPRMIAMGSDIGTVTILQQIHVSNLIIIEL